MLEAYVAQKGIVVQSGINKLLIDSDWLDSVEFETGPVSYGSIAVYHIGAVPIPAAKRMQRKDNQYIIYRKPVEYERGKTYQSHELNSNPVEGMIVKERYSLFPTVRVGKSWIQNGFTMSILKGETYEVLFVPGQR